MWDRAWPYWPLCRVGHDSSPSVPPSPRGFLRTSLTVVSGYPAGSPVLVLQTRSLPHSPFEALYSSIYILSQSSYFSYRLYVGDTTCQVLSSVDGHVGERGLAGDRHIRRAYWRHMKLPHLHSALTSPRSSRAVFPDLLRCSTGSSELHPQPHFLPPLLFLGLVNGVIIHLAIRLEILENCLWFSQLSSLTSKVTVKFYVPL